MVSNLTTYDGRQCTKVRRAGRTKPTPKPDQRANQQNTTQVAQAPEPPSRSKSIDASAAAAAIPDPSPRNAGPTRVQGNFAGDNSQSPQPRSQQTSNPSPKSQLQQPPVLPPAADASSASNRSDAIVASTQVKTTQSSLPTVVIVPLPVSFGSSNAVDPASASNGGKASEVGNNDSEARGESSLKSASQSRTPPVTKAHFVTSHTTSRIQTQQASNTIPFPLSSEGAITISYTTSTIDPINKNTNFASESSVHVNGGSFASIPSSIPSAPSSVSSNSILQPSTNVQNAISGNSNDSNTSQKPATTSVVAGSVTAVLAFSMVIAALWYCFKRRKNKINEKSSMSASENSPKLDSGLSSIFVGFFGRRKNKRHSSSGINQANSPVLEEGLRRISTSETIQNRSLSEPASPAFNSSAPTLRASGFGFNASHSRGQIYSNSQAPQVKNTIFAHRRSVSSFGGLVYPAVREESDPFADPEPSNDFESTVSDISTISAGQFPQVVGASFSHHKRNSSSGKHDFDPFSDSQAEDSKDRFAVYSAKLFPSVAPLRLPSSLPYSQSISNHRSASVRHSRTRTFGNIPIITRTAPSTNASMSGSDFSNLFTTNSSTDNSPIIRSESSRTAFKSTPRVSTLVGSSAFGLGISETQSFSHTKLAPPTPHPSCKPGFPIHLFDTNPPPQEDPILANSITPSKIQTIAPKIQHSPARQQQTHLLDPLSTFLGPAASIFYRPFSTQSTASRSSLSSSLSLALPASWGEAGPTRPVSTVTSPLALFHDADRQLGQLEQLAKLEQQEQQQQKQQHRQQKQQSYPPFAPPPVPPRAMMRSLAIPAGPGFVSERGLGTPSPVRSNASRVSDPFDLDIWVFGGGDSVVSTGVGNSNAQTSQVRPIMEKR